MRIFYNEIEITKEIEKLDSSTYSFSYTAGTFFYFASDFPFNHLFFKTGAVKNIVPANMKVEYWGSSKWHEVVELRDETSAFSQDGYVEFTPDRDDGWSREDESEDVGLTKVVYDKYWVRISFDQNLTVSSTLSFIGHKFSDDGDLFIEYPILNDSNFLTAYKAGKTSWEEQHVKAAEMITLDLMKKGVILGAEQILEKRKFIGASVCKVAEIIFTAFGNDYVEQRRSAREEYYHRLDLGQYAIDSNSDGILNPSEVKMKQGWLSR